MAAYSFSNLLPVIEGKPANSRSDLRTFRPNPPQRPNTHTYPSIAPKPKPPPKISVRERETSPVAPAAIIPPVPMPRSISFRRVVPSRESDSPPESIFSPETSEQRSKKRRSQSMDDIFGSTKLTAILDLENGFRTMSDCVPSPLSDSSYASSSGSNSSTDSSSSPTCEISLLERLIRTHPVWFLPSLQRSGALHLLQGRDVGNFIVRSSTLPLTMAVSVKLPGNLVEHYLLRAVDNRIALENSTHTFETVHQLISHYCTVSDEIPVCLRVPSAIAESTTRQQLRSLALLGQEFWTHASSGNGKELSSPSDIEITTKNFISSGLGSQSQSSSSQNSLCDVRRPSRPTTLELGTCMSSGGTGTATPPPVPPRWSRSALLTPLSLPSSIQSTPSEIQSTFSEKSSGRALKKKKRHSGGKAESIHYKDTEILDLFKGTKTSYDDKASDYEDIWSPQYAVKSGAGTPQAAPRLSTFKPDLIASSLGSDLDTLYKKNPRSQFQSLSSVNNNNESGTTPTQLNNSKNNRLSFNGNTLNMNTIQTQQVNLKEKNLPSPIDKPINKNNVSKSKSSLYSEPVDAIVFRRFTNYRHSEPNIRWSQPAMMSLINVTNQLPDIPHSPVHQSEEQPGIKKTAQHTSSLANVNTAENSKNNNRNAATNQKQRNQSMTCVSVDNLCHLREFRKRSKSKLNCGGGGMEASEDEEEPILENKPLTEEPIRIVPVASNTADTNKNSLKPQPAPRKRLTEDHREERTMLDISNNQSWRLDRSWEFVEWEKNEEENQKLLEKAAQKFPVQQISPNNNSGLLDSDTMSQSEEALNNNHPSLNLHRFSRYDNLESREDEEEVAGSFGEGEELSDIDREEKISAPWDSSKWEHLLRIVSESTQQLDSIQVVEGGTLEMPAKNQGGSLTSDKFRNRESKIIPDSKQRISKVIEVSGNVEKAGKAITSVVRDLAKRESGVFGPTLKSFISCTIAAKIQDPFYVMRNIRQFISGMKNYLVGPEICDLKNEIKKQTELLSDCEFLNIDAILEEVLVDLVISPLNEHVRGLLQIHHARSNEPLKLTQTCLLSTFSSNPSSIHEIQKQEAQEKLKQLIQGLEEAISPIKKLDKWNEFVCQVQEMDNYSSESFLPFLADVLGSVCSSNIASHVDYMIGLLPHSLAEQNNYSISVLQSALAALKSRRDRQGSQTLTSIKVIVPDERNGTLIRKMVPIRETTTTKDVAKIVASKAGIANPGDYILVRIKDGEERPCPDGELVSSFIEEDSKMALAYRRVDAKIGWPQKMKY